MEEKISGDGRAMVGDDGDDWWLWIFGGGVVLRESSCRSKTTVFFNNNNNVNNNNKHSLLLLRRLFRFRANSSTSESPNNDDDCNTEECAPDKEVGQLNMGWVAEEKTKVVGTFPPRTRGWTGYVEKDTAGQTNIYSVEPAVYVAESAISSGTAGSSADGSENTVAIAAGLGLVVLAATSSIVFQVGKNPSPVQTLEYSGPSLSYYINKFKPPEIIQASSVPTTETKTKVFDMPGTSPETDVSAVQIDSSNESNGPAPSSNVSLGN
ncbi:hypothetical protein LguiA_010816 [Lonicera macranthoides]